MSSDHRQKLFDLDALAVAIDDAGIRKELERYPAGVI